MTSLPAVRQCSRGGADGSRSPAGPVPDRRWPGRPRQLRSSAREASCSGRPPNVTRSPKVRHTGAMPLTPEEIASRQFAFAFRGLDKDEVISFLHHVADEYRLVMEAMAEVEAAVAEARAGADNARAKAREIEQELASHRTDQSTAREHLRAADEARAMEAAKVQ